MKVVINNKSIEFDEHMGVHSEGNEIIFQCYQTLSQASMCVSNQKAALIVVKGVLEAFEKKEKEIIYQIL